MADAQESTKRLSLKQRKFCLAYVGEANGNGMEAARIAGYNAKTDNALRVIASQNLTKPAVQRCIAELRADAEAAARQKIMDSTEVLTGLSDIARGDIADVLGDEAPEWLRKAKEGGISKLIKAINFDAKTGEVTRVELYSSHDARRDLGKHHGLFPTRITLTTSEADEVIDRAIRDHGLPGDDQADEHAASEYPM